MKNFSSNLEDNSDKILEAFNNAIERGLEAIGVTAEGYAKKDCPVDTGRLRNSIAYKIKENDVYIGSNVEYAPSVELGTYRQRAQPFLKPAAANHAKEYKDILEDSLKNA